MNIKSVILGTASAAALVLASNASAADLSHLRAHNPIKPVAINSVAPFSWEGFYAGVQGGWFSGENQGRVHSPKAGDDKKKNDNKFEKVGDSKNGIAAGLYAGFNTNVGNDVIAGIDANIDYNTYKNEISDKADKNKIIASQKIPFAGDVRARLGYSLDRLLPYVAGGVSFADISSAADDVKGIKDDKIGDQKIKGSSQFGWNIGAGVDYAVSDSVILRADYRYSRFADPKVSHLNDQGKIIQESDKNSDTRLVSNSVRVGIAYKF